MTRIVTMKDSKPLAVKKKDMDEDVLWVCRCGLSADWPWCDGSHKRTRDEEDATTYRYRRDVAGGELVREEADADPAPSDPRPSGEPA